MRSLAVALTELDLTPGSPEWARVPEDPRYLVSTNGDVIGPKGRALKSSDDGKGYRFINLGIGKSRRIHTLVATAFIGPIESGFEIDHINANRTDNRLVNLRIVTHAENMAAIRDRNPNCRSGHPLVERGWRRVCPTCIRSRDARRVR